MKKLALLKRVPGLHGVAVGVALLFPAAIGSQAYPNYSDPTTGSGMCFGCHQDFRGTHSEKGTVFGGGNNHNMHRQAANMGTSCDLCHTGDSNTRFPVYIKSSNGTTNNPGLGCTGCHMALGLRAHHAANGVTVCATCHTSDGPPPPETTKPQYYGTADTHARNPGNDILAANTNENWSVGDFLGLDNDGNNLYDLADYAVGPYKILSVIREANDMRITWQTAGGRTNSVQAAGSVAGLYSNVSPAIEIPGVGVVTTNALDVGGATNPTRFYRLRQQMR